MEQIRIFPICLGVNSSELEATQKERHLLEESAFAKKILKPKNEPYERNLREGPKMGSYGSYDL